MKAHELTAPGLYWYSRDGEARGFASVRLYASSDPEAGLEFRPLENGDAAGWHYCRPSAKGDFYGPVPELPPVEGIK